MRTALLIIISIAALASLSYGSWLVYKPAGFLVGGALVWIEIWRATAGPVPAPAKEPED